MQPTGENDAIQGSQHQSLFLADWTLRTSSSNIGFHAVGPMSSLSPTVAILIHVLFVSVLEWLMMKGAYLVCDISLLPSGSLYMCIIGLYSDLLVFQSFSFQAFSQDIGHCSGHIYFHLRPLFLYRKGNEVHLLQFPLCCISRTSLGVAGMRLPSIFNLYSNTKLIHPEAKCKPFTSPSPGHMGSCGHRGGLRKRLECNCKGYLRV